MEEKSNKIKKELKKLHKEIIYNKKNLKILEELDLNYKSLVALQKVQKLNSIEIPYITHDGISYFLNKSRGDISSFQIL